MKKFTILVLAAFAFSTSQAQGIFDKIKKATAKDSTKSSGSVLNKVLGSKGSSLSNDEIIQGLKQALTIGTDSSAKRLNKADGFFANAAIKILMPEEAKKAEKTLRQFGMGSLVDKAVLSMNRAAEDAAGGISTIFIDAIKGMTLTDGLSILRGGDFAATEYLKKNTTAQLTEKMRPIIEASLAKVNATQYWKDVFTAYNKLSKTPVNTDLSAYVTERSLTGVFYSVGQEEQKIRKDPAAQVTGLLKKVFGGQ
ncbi:MAG: DUF4197 domain-containing protein [Chitinophagaceae bacterium]|nr:MAG: DUF4197 domain-containing protein [Chitinophagaceae bacterium]